MLIILMLYKMEFGISDRYYNTMVKEDGPVEYLSALLFLVGSVVALKASLLAQDVQSKLFTGLFSAGLLFIALSEVSFGQRIFGWGTPEPLKAINIQDETTIHNIRGVQYVVYEIMPLVILAYALFGQMVAWALANSMFRKYFSADVLRIAPVPW